MSSRPNGGRRRVAAYKAPLGTRPQDRRYRLSSFGVLGGLIGLADGDMLKVLLGFADLILGAIFYAHTKASRSN